MLGGLLNLAGAMGSILDDPLERRRMFERLAQSQQNALARDLVSNVQLGLPPRSLHMNGLGSDRHIHIETKRNLKPTPTTYREQLQAEINEWLDG